MNAIARCQPQSQPPLNEATLCDDDERKSRHLRVCRELIDIGMDLARIAASRAKNAETQAATAAASPTAAPVSPTLAKAAKSADPIVAFTRLASLIRQIMVLEAHTAAGPQPAAGELIPVAGASIPAAGAGSAAAGARPAASAEPAAAALPTPPLPNRNLQALRKAFEQGTATHPDRERLLPLALERMQEVVAIDPDGELSDCDIIDIVCGELGYELALPLIAPETLDALTETFPPGPPGGYRDLYPEPDP